MAYTKLHYIPMIAANLMALNLVICLVLAYSKKHITYYVPYISDAGTHPPESCVFGLFLNLVSAMIALVMYIIYKHAEFTFERRKADVRLQTINKIAFSFGIISTAGLWIVANFQQTNVLWLHWTGALLAFGFSSIYQYLITFIYRSIRQAPKIYIIKIILSTVSSVSFIIYSITGLIALSKFSGTDPTKWKHDDPGFHLHIVSTITEWICATSTMVYLLVFGSDLKTIKLNSLNFKVVNTQDRFEQ